MRINPFRNNYFIYIRIKAEGIRGFSIVLPLFPLMQCMDAFYDTYSLLALCIPPLKRAQNHTITMIEGGFTLLYSLLHELALCETRDLVEVTVPKDHVKVVIRLL